MNAITTQQYTHEALKTASGDYQAIGAAAAKSAGDVLAALTSAVNESKRASQVKAKCFYESKKLQTNLTGDTGVHLPGFDTDGLDLLHAGLGLVDEAGEFADWVINRLRGGLQTDTKNAIEELGDILWFVVLAARSLDVSLDDIMVANIRKLRTRYGESFTQEAAQNRNLAAELDAMAVK